MMDDLLLNVPSEHSAPMSPTVDKWAGLLWRFLKTLLFSLR